MLFRSDTSEDGNVPDGGGARASKVGTLDVIVETNMQVVAYVSSELHLAMLKLFVDISIRMPNMAMGKVDELTEKILFACPPFSVIQLSTAI
jgi:hypothetical protein